MMEIPIEINPPEFVRAPPRSFAVAVAVQLVLLLASCEQRRPSSDSVAAPPLPASSPLPASPPSPAEWSAPPPSASRISASAASRPVRTEIFALGGDLALKGPPPTGTRQSWDKWRLALHVYEDNTVQIGEAVFGGAHVGTLDRLERGPSKMSFTVTTAAGEFDCSVRRDGTDWAGTCNDRDADGAKYSIRFAPIAAPKEPWFHQMGLANPGE